MFTFQAPTLSSFQAPPTNVTFTDNNGRLNEVDVLMLTRAGLYVVELKGWHGTVSGNQREWVHAGRREANPRILANAKAKRLASVLKDVAFRARVPAATVPFVDEAVVLHGRDAKISLDDFGAEHVWALDGFRVHGLADAQFSRLVAAAGSRPIDRTQAKAIDALMDAAGLMPRARQRMIGQYALDTGEPLGEGPGWQDFLVTHPVAGTKRRIRLFAYPKGADRDTRAAVDLRAKREFRLTDGITHPGIIGPLELLTPEDGPALVFAYDPDEVSLGDYLAGHADDLAFDDRERIVQDLIELVRFAHGQRLMHRALSPTSVRVRHAVGDPVTIRIRDWDLARRPDTETAKATVLSRGITNLVGAVDPAVLMYLAPETLRGATPASPQTLDVYGVGAVAFTVLTGKPPAVNLAALEKLVASDAVGLDPRAVMPEIADRMADAIIGATAFDEIARFADVVDFQTQLDNAREALRMEARAGAPEEVREPSPVDPLDASAGESIGERERFQIIKRRGSGSTGVALLVDDYETGREGDILKLAKDDDAAERLRTEATVLGKLEHPRIVRLLDGPLQVGTRQGLLLTDAGAETLADRIRLEGRGTIEQLERYGADLFAAAMHLDERGVFHRDIKPSNLAVKPDAGSRAPHLTLFDFSLAGEPLANIHSGSRPYLDPYLGSRGRRQYDSAAERFAIAATLFEMASAYPVWWASGDAPMDASDAPIVQADMFDPAVADGLVTFFHTALHPDATHRHPSLAAMRAAWSEALAGAVVDDQAAEANDARADAATLDTPLREAGLSARALSAVARVNATTVGELLGVPPMTINQIRGNGERVRREIRARVRQWRERLTHTTTVTDVAAATGTHAVEWYLGQTNVRLGGESNADRFKRLRKTGTLKTLRDDVVRWLREFEGIATVDELAARMLREYGSTEADASRRMSMATSVVGAVLDLDHFYQDPRFVQLRIPGTATLAHATADARERRTAHAEHGRTDHTRVVVADAPDDGTGLSFDDATQHLDTLRRLGGTVDELLRADDVVSAPRLREALHDALRDDREAGAGPALRMADARLAQLAIGLSHDGRMSSMGEAYRATLDPARAVEYALRSAATRQVAIATIEQRVHARFAAVTDIPARPVLDAAVRNAMPYLEWDTEHHTYTLRSTEQASATATASSTSWGKSAGDPAVVARLMASVRDHGALALVVSRRRPLATVTSMLAHGYHAQVVDLAGVALDALRETAAARRISWQKILTADAPDASATDRRNLHHVARLAIAPVWNDLMASPRPTVLVNAAVLARLGLVDLLAAVMDMSTPRPGARWFVLPRPLSSGVPDLDGVPMPYGADGWIELAADAIPAAEPAGHAAPPQSDALPRSAGRAACKTPALTRKADPS